MRPLGSLDVQLTLSLKKGNCGDPFVYLRNIFIYFLQVLVFVEYHWHVFLALLANPRPYSILCCFAFNK